MILLNADSAHFWPPNCWFFSLVIRLTTDSMYYWSYFILIFLIADFFHCWFSTILTFPIVDLYQIWFSSQIPLQNLIVKYELICCWPALRGKQIQTMSFICGTRKKMCPYDSCEAPPQKGPIMLRKEIAVFDTFLKEALHLTQATCFSKFLSKTAQPVICFKVGRLTELTEVTFCHCFRRPSSGSKQTRRADTCYCPTVTTATETEDRSYK